MPLHRVVVLVKEAPEVVQALVGLVLEGLVKVPEDTVEEV
jgi:hypothetical protein